MGGRESGSEWGKEPDNEGETFGDVLCLRILRLLRSKIFWFTSKQYNTFLFQFIFFSYNSFTMTSAQDRLWEITCPVQKFNHAKWMLNDSRCRWCFGLNPLFADRTEVDASEPFQTHLPSRGVIVINDDEAVLMHEPSAVTQRRVAVPPAVVSEASRHRNKSIRQTQVQAAARPHAGTPIQSTGVFSTGRSRPASGIMAEQIRLNLVPLIALFEHDEISINWVEYRLLRTILHTILKGHLLIDYSTLLYPPSIGQLYLHRHGHLYSYEAWRANSQLGYNIP